MRRKEEDELEEEDGRFKEEMRERGGREKEEE
jgi:hypothetical protein